MGPLICLVWRELTVLFRTSAFWAAAGVYVSALTAFVVVWGDGVPIAGGGTNWEQFISVWNALLLIALPWVAVRCGSATAPEVALLSAVTACEPSRILLAKWVGLSGALAGFGLLALPVVLLMRSIAAVTPATAVAGLVPLMALAVFVAALTAASTMLPLRPLHGWMIVAVMTLVAGWLIPLVPAALSVWLLIAVAIVASSAVSADRKLTYSSEERA